MNNGFTQKNNPQPILAMNNVTFRKLLFSALLFLLSITSILAQDAQADLVDGTILCDKRMVSIASFNGAGIDTKEADDGCLKDITETNTTWFTWEAASDGTLSFDIQPAEGSDQFSFSLFQLPNGLNNGTDKVALRCALPCRTGTIGLRDGDNDFVIDDCATATDGFMASLNMEVGLTYGLMIENTTSNNGFSISFGGDGELVGPVGKIIPSVTEACFGQTLNFQNDITFANGSITRYDWTFEDGDDIQTRTFQQDLPQDFDFQTTGTKRIELVVTTSIGCTATFETSITINDCCDSDNKVEITNEVFSEIKCPDDTNGAIDITVTNANEGQFPSIFAWSNGATTEDIMDLPPDTYTVTVSNAAGCKDSLEHTFVIPNALTAVETVTPPSCGGLADGIIEISASGGRMPYEYDFGDGNGFVSNEVLNGLDTGDYEVIVRDDSGCTTTIQAIELDDKELTITFDTIAITCFGLNDGQVNITNPPNGTAPFQYDFNDGNGLVDATALSNLGPGNYTIDVFDAEGCTGNTVDFNLREPEAFSVRIGESRKFCNGKNDGFAVAVAVGGTGDLMYSWNNGSSGTTANDLPAGEYSVTVTDEKGCEANSDTVNLVDQPLLTAVIDTVIDVTCSSETDGQIDLMIEGGVMPYEYSLDGINFQAGTTIGDLAPGDYDIVVQDNFQCQTTLNTTTITSPESLSFSVSSLTDICYGESLTFTNTSTFTRGEIATINWDFVETTATGETPEIEFTTIGKPTVTLTIETDLGCTAVLTEELDIAVEPCCDKDNGLSFLPFVEEPFCAGSTDGAITLNTFSIPPITSIAWDNMATTDIIENLGAGEYTVTVTNDATCDSTLSITLNEPSLINASLAITQPSCDAASNGAISIIATGGTLDGNGAYEFDFGDGFSTNNMVENLSVGAYSIMVRDDNNCIVPVDTNLAVPAGFNPISADLLIAAPSCDAASNGAINVNATGKGSNFEYDFGNGFSSENNTTDLVVGDYTITIRDGDNCTLSIDTSIMVPIGFNPINATIDITTPTCVAAANGMISIMATGVGGDFEYDFGTGFSNENNADNLIVGDYTLTVRDGDNCTLTIDTSLAVPAGFNPINADLNIVSPSCDEATNGAIFVIIPGNSAGFDYDFGAGFSDENSVEDLMVGDYSVTIRDADNCTLSIDTSLSVSANLTPVQATLQVTHPSCGGGQDGSITVLPSGELGTDLANYSFDFGTGVGNSNTSDNLTQGQYLVVVRNANNCSIALDTQLSELVLEPTFIVARPTCFGRSDGSILIDVPAPGVGPFMYEFEGSTIFQEENALTNLPEGNYTVRVQDANLCLSEPLTVLIDQPDELTLSLDATDISCFGENDGRIVAEVSGGVGNYIYDWSNGQTTNIAGNLSAGDYTLNVLDGNDCPINSNSTTIIEPAELFVQVGQVDNVLCFGETNGAITVDAMGGSAPYEYSLDGVIFQPAATLSNLPAGDYTIIVKDSRACEIPTQDITVAEPTEFIVNASVDNEVTKLGFPINLSAEANTTDGSINYTWSIPDSVVCSNCPRFETVPPGSTTYTVTAVNSTNCQATASVNVAVSLDRPVYIPNIFSPNGDGINDEFFIPFSPAMTAVKQLRIFDRSGNMVFEATDIQFGEELIKAWDGRFNGDKIRQGVFAISAQISFVDGQTLPYQSDVTLITSE